MDASDRALYARLYSDPDVMRHIAEPITGAAVDASFDAALALQPGQAGFAPRWIVLDRGTGNGIGLLGLIRDANRRSAEIGVMLLPDAQGRGFAAEALAAAAAAVFRSRCLGELWARHSSRHARMARVFSSLGYECVMRGIEEYRWRLAAGDWARRNGAALSPVA